MRRLRLLIGQFAADWQQPQASCQRLADEFIAQAPADLLLLPEMFASGFSMKPAEFVADFAVADWLQNFAFEHAVNVIAGVAEQQEDGFVNCALAFNRQGQLQACYRKQRLFSHAGENRIYQSGSQPAIVEIEGSPIALFICYDLRFPELFRPLAQQVEVMVVVANWPQSRQRHWQALLLARAIENQCYVVGVNRTGTDGNGLQYGGGSMVIDPNGEVLLQMDNQPWALCDIDLDCVQQQRRRFAFLQDYRQ